MVFVVTDLFQKDFQACFFAASPPKSEVSPVSASCGRGIQAYQEQPILSALLRESPWTHHMTIISLDGPKWRKNASSMFASLSGKSGPAVSWSASSIDPVSSAPLKAEGTGEKKPALYKNHNTIIPIKSKFNIKHKIRVIEVEN
jgi:hypothetical protein